MRPSTLGPVKRKCEMDEYEPNPKKWGLHISNNRYVYSDSFNVLFISVTEDPRWFIRK